MQKIQCDVLVIGGGLAGCWAALRAKELVPHVVLVDTGKVSRRGKSSFSGAAVLYPVESDDLNLWHREMVEKGEYVNDQDWVSVLLQEQGQRVKDMENWGVVFEKDGKGNPVRSPVLGQTHCKAGWVSSLQMMETLRLRMETEGVTIIDRIMVTGLLTSDGRYPTHEAVTGAYGFHTRTGEPYIINSRATIVATGGTGYFHLSGDGIAQAFRAGAEVYGMEFTRTFDNMDFEGKYLAVHLATFQRLNMRLVNSLGERFMEHYQPQLKEKARRQDLGLAIVSEGMQGRGPIYIDMTHLDADGLHQLRTLPTTARRVQAIEREGIDFGKQKVRFHVTSGFLHIDSGGVRNNIYCETNIAGLYVAGEAGGFPSSGGGTITTKLATCCVSGYRAGENSARYAIDQDLRAIDEKQLRQLEKEAIEPMKAKEGFQPHALWQEVEGFLSDGNVSVFRSARSLSSILEKCKEWQSRAQTLKAFDLHELVKANKVRNFIKCVELVFRASLEREETRGLNIRIDYPYRDDINWLKWVVMRQDQKEEIVADRIPLPMYRYPVRPQTYSKVDVNIPFPKAKKKETGDC